MIPSQVDIRLLRRSGAVLLLIAALFLWLASPHSALAQGPGGDEFVFGGDYELRSGDTLDGDLYLFGVNATLEEDSVVNGDILVLGGNLDGQGEINGDISLFGGNVSLGDTALVRGDVNVTGGNLDRSSGPQIDGDVGGLVVPFDFDSQVIDSLPRSVRSTNPLWDGLWFLLRAFLWAGLSILVVLFLPRQTGRVSRAVSDRPMVSLGVGVLTVLVFPLGLILLVITLVGIPAAILAVVLLAIVWAFGITSLGVEVGRRMAEWLHQDWAQPVSAGLGTLVLVLVTNGIGEWVICIGWLAPFLAGALGVGAVLLTRFGTQAYPPEGSRWDPEGSAYLPVTPVIPSAPPAGSIPTTPEIQPAPRDET